MQEKLIQDTYFLQTSAQIRAIAHPMRWRMLNLLIARPMTGSQLSRLLKITRPKAHYHMKYLEKVGLIQFVEERLYNGIMEKYYRAIAKSYRTDNLLARARELEFVSADLRQTDEALHNIFNSMLAMVGHDLSDPEVGPRLLKMNYSYQEDVWVTKEQFQAMKSALAKLAEEFSSYNLANEMERPGEELQNFRYTLLLTPTGMGHLSADENGR